MTPRRPFSKLSLVVAVGLCLSAQPVFAQTTRLPQGSSNPSLDSAGEREVRATEAARFTAMSHSDLAALDTLLGAELTYTHNDGTRESKSVFLASIRSGDITYLALQS